MGDTYLCFDTGGNKVNAKVREAIITSLRAHGSILTYQERDLSKCSVFLYVVTDVSANSIECWRLWRRAMRLGMPTVVLRFKNAIIPPFLDKPYWHPIVHNGDFEETARQLNRDIKLAVTGEEIHGRCLDALSSCSGGAETLDNIDFDKQALNIGTNSLIQLHDVKECGVIILHGATGKSLAHWIGDHLTRLGASLTMQDVGVNAQNSEGIPVNSLACVVSIVTDDIANLSILHDMLSGFVDTGKSTVCVFIGDFAITDGLRSNFSLQWKNPNTYNFADLVDSMNRSYLSKGIARLNEGQSSFTTEIPKILTALRQGMNDSVQVCMQNRPFRNYQPKNVEEYWLIRYSDWCSPEHWLDKRFVRLTMMLDQEGEEEGGLRRWSVQERQTSFDDLRTILRADESPAMVLLGVPGAGKSTLLRRLEMDAAIDGIKGGWDKVPFYVQLSEYSSYMDANTVLPMDWLSQGWNRRFPHMPSLSTLVREGRVLFLLDALNEMPHSDPRDFREKAKRWQHFLHENIRDIPGNRAVFACRTLDYGGMLSSRDFRVPQIRLELMSHSQVKEYLNKYCEEHAETIWERLRDDEKLFGVFRVPYYLKMLIDQVRTKGTMPLGRAETFTGSIYGLLVREVMKDNPLLGDGDLLTWREEKSLRLDEKNDDKNWLPEDGMLIPALMKLAYRMQEARPGEEMGVVAVSRDEAAKLLDIDSARCELILRAGCDLSILDEANGKIRFFHQLLQEYFAARLLARECDLSRIRTEWRSISTSPSLADVIENIAVSDPLPLLPENGWGETAVIAAAMAKNPDSFVKSMAEVNLPLAGRCVAAPDVCTSEDISSAIRMRLVQRCDDKEADLRARIMAGLVLGRVGDPRYFLKQGIDGQYLYPPLVQVKHGSYLIGSEDSPYPLEAPVHEVQVNELRISKFPVTNAEYYYFIKAGGYKDESLWQVDGALAWLNGKGTRELERQRWHNKRENLRKRPTLPVELLLDGRVTVRQAVGMMKIIQMPDEEFTTLVEEWQDSDPIRTQPRFWDNQLYNNPAQPVVGVSWYEANAYCIWLSRQTGNIFRLLSEAEWEAAAGGDEQRYFAFGNIFQSEFCNTYESHIRAVVPVGVFPEGNTPEGCADLSGNVFEWVADNLHPYGSNESQSEYNMGEKVCRGGSWDHKQVRARSSYRGRGHPVTRNDDLGFRICCENVNR